MTNEDFTKNNEARIRETYPMGTPVIWQGFQSQIISNPRWIGDAYKVLIANKAGYVPVNDLEIINN